MSLRSIDFQGIAEVDDKIVDQLQAFLQEKEMFLAHQIASLIPSVSTGYPPPLSLNFPVFQLSEAVEVFSKHVHLFATNQLPSHRPHPHEKQVVNTINEALWDFLELLEGCVMELFQQAQQVPIDRWHISIAQVVNAIQEILMHHLENLKWALQHLEKPLKEYGLKTQQKKKSWMSWHVFGETDLDPQLFKNVAQTEKFLKKQDEEFKQRYRDYMLLSFQVEEHLEKMKTYPILALLDVPEQNLYVDIFRLLKMIELNRKGKKEVTLEMTRALKQLTSIDDALRLFRIYYRELKDAFFNSSFEWKSLSQEEENFQEAHHNLQGKVKDYQHELRHLMQTMSHYRAFILKNLPNPYARSRWGFTEWIVGPEPAKGKKLIHMIYAAEELDKHFTHFAESLAGHSLTQYHLNHQAHQEIDKLLHEMGQPLISRPRMHYRVEQLLKQLQLCDEIGSADLSIVEYVEEVLSKAMRVDWKYHVLYEFPLFHQIYHLHQGMKTHFKDPSHAFRLERFHLLLDQIEEWVKKEDVYTHVKEIELDINDIKTYLQDFLATIQRVVKDKSHDPFLDETTHKLRHQLLEYRYLFGQFFSHISAKSQDGLALRNQFLFVDQYFESAENLLNNLKLSWEGKH